MRVLPFHFLKCAGHIDWLVGVELSERALADFSRQYEARGEEFRMKDFFDRLNSIDSIPISLARWEMTGLDDEVRLMLGGE